MAEWLKAGLLACLPGGLGVGSKEGGHLVWLAESSRPSLIKQGFWLPDQWAGIASRRWKHRPLTPRIAIIPSIDSYAQTKPHKAHHRFIFLACFLLFSFASK